MITRTFILAVVIAVFLTATGPASARVDWINWNGSWSASTLVTGEYVSVTGNSNSAGTVYAAKPYAGIDWVVYTSQWIASPLYSGGPYLDLTSKLSTGLGEMYGVNLSGGVDRIYWNGSWTSTNLVPGNYLSVAVKSDDDNACYGACANGGINLIWQNGGVWVAAWIGVAGRYVDLAPDATHQGDLWAVRADGGIDFITHSGGWTASPVVNGNYLSVCAISSGSSGAYASRADGGIDWIYYSGGWQAQTILPSNTVYSDICMDLQGNGFIHATTKPSPSVAAAPYIYYYQMEQSADWNTKYDIYHTAACIQGLANRDAPRLFVHAWGASDYWPWFSNWGGDYDMLLKLTESGGLCEGRPIYTLYTIDGLVDIFRPYINGLVLYDADPDTGGVSSTSLAATTAAACENAIAVRKDMTPGSMYDWLLNTKHIPVLIDLAGKFTGTGTIWDTSTASTGSAKCDAYIWAKQKYIDTGRCNPAVLSYTLDGWPLKDSIRSIEGMVDQWLELTNLDYAVAKKGFCFELSPWGDERPNDDPTQPLGTDLNTYRAILAACNTKTGQGKMIKFCGFPNWLWKYTTHNSHGAHDPVATEWETAKILSAYNTYMEGDCGAISNASFYAGLMPLIKKVAPFRYLQNPPPTYTDMRNRGLINANGTIPNGNYVMVGLGDYDGAAWTLYDLANKRYLDATRGQRYCNWAVDPQLSDRACVAIDYMFRHRTAKDYFIAWDSGAGYVNPYQLYGSRSPSGYGSGVAIWQKHCKDYYRMFDYSISGWLLNSGINLTNTDYTNYAPFSGDGIGAHTAGSATTYINGVPCNRMTGDFGSNYYYDPSDTVINYASGINFGWYRTIKWHPSDIINLENAYAGSGHNHRFLDAFTYYYLLRYHLSGRQQSSNYYRASWVYDTIPRVMAAGQTYPVTVTVRNDGWDTWTEASMYRLAHAAVAPGVEPTTTNFDANPRHYLPTGASVAPGQSVTFSFNITAPTTNGKYDLFYTMVRDGTTWFQSKNNLECKRDLIVATNTTDVDTDGDGVPDVTEEANGTLYWHPDSHN